MMKILRVKLVGLVLLFVLMAKIVAAQGITPKKADSIPLDPELCYGKLKNGLTYYICNSEKADITVSLAVKTGWRNEDADQLGMAHLIEHVLMQGGTTHGQGGVYGFKLREGIMSYQSFAVTGINETVYNWTIPGNRPELLTKSLLMLRDYARDTLVVSHLNDPTIVDNERRTVLEEFGGHNRTDYERTYKILGEPKGHRMYDPAIAYDRHNEYIRTFKLEPLVRFYHEWYRPNLQAVIIVGNVDTAQIKKEIENRFSDLKNPEIAREKTLSEYLDEYTIKLNNKNRLLTFVNKNIHEITVEILMKNPRSVTTINTKEQFKINLIEELYNKIMYSRFRSLTQRYNPLFKYANHLIKTLTPPDAQLDILHTIVNIEDPHSIGSAVKLVFTELKRAKLFGFAASELIKARDELLKENKQNGENMLSRSVASDYLSHFVFNAAAPGERYKRTLTDSLLNNISLEDLNKVARTWLSSDSNRDIVINAPENDKSLLPDETEILRWIKEVNAANITPNKNSLAPKSLMSSEAMKKLSDKIVYEQSEIDEIGVTQLTLVNGVKLILKPLKASGNSYDEIVVQGFRPGGASIYKKEDYYSAIKSTEIIMNSGVGGLNKFQLEQFLSDKKAFVSPFINNGSEGIIGSSSVANLETLLQLAYQYFVSPNKNKDAFADWLSKQRRELDNRENNATAKFFDGIEMAMRPNDRRFTRQSLEQIKFERAYEIYKERFADASDFTFVISGDFDPLKIKPLLMKYFGSLPAINRKELPQKPEIIKYKNGFNQTSYGADSENSLPVALIFSGDYSSNEKNNSIMDILQNVLRSVLWARLVEKEGTYGIVSGVQYQSRPEQRFQARIQFNSDTNGIERRIAAVLEEIAKLRHNGPDTKFFEGAIAEVKQKLKNDMESNQFWANYLAKKYEDSEDPTAIINRSAMLDKITKEDIKAAAQKYLIEENFNRFVLLPESIKSK